MRHPLHARLIPTLSLAAGLAFAATTASAQDDEYPKITFEYNPTYYDSNQVSLTFDDGPAWAPANTLAVLDLLAAHEPPIKATFFVNTGALATTIENEQSTLAIQRIIDEGHELGTHTLSHAKLINMTIEQVDEEINGVQASLATVGRGDYRISMFRAPYGEPYQWKWQEAQQWTLEGEAVAGVAKYDEIAPLAAATMVHVGWNLDSDDWRCASMALPGESEADCFSRIIIEKLSGTWDDPWSDEMVKYYGNILMHSITPRTAEGLPKVLDYLEENNYEIVSTEYAICRKYGSSSANLVDGKTGGCDGVGPTDDDDGDDTSEDDTSEDDTSADDDGNPDGSDNGDDDDGDVSDGDDNDDDDDDDDGPGSIEDPNGCACTVGPSSEAPWGFLGLGLLVATFVSRRRKSRRA